MKPAPTSQPTRPPPPPPPPDRPRFTTQAEIADRLNEEGKKLMRDSQYEQSAKKFSEAAARIPDPKYFFNLAVARTSTGELDEAVAAINTLMSLSPPPPDILVQKAKLLLKKINELAKANEATASPH